MLTLTGKSIGSGYINQIKTYRPIKSHTQIRSNLASTQKSREALSLKDLRLAKQKLTETSKQDIGESMCKQTTGTVDDKCIGDICEG